MHLVPEYIENIYNKSQIEIHSNNLLLSSCYLLVSQSCLGHLQIRTQAKLNCD